MLETFTALAEPTRLKIVELLGGNPRSVGEICDRLAVGQPQASKHLRVLRDLGLVDVEARAQQRIYSLRPEPLRAMHAWLDRYRRIWEERLDQLDALAAELTAQDTKERPHGRRKKS
jgi:DNA-binding transcriptional ArsR family regulator